MNKRIRYTIFQLREDMDENIPIFFASYNTLKKTGEKPTIDRYQEVYRDVMASNENTEALLDYLYEKFNLRKPKIFTGHSLSVSDVVGLDMDGEKSFYYVDSIGFQKLEDFDEETERIG